MQYIQGQPRQQTYFATLEDQVAADNPVRLIDAFINKLDHWRNVFPYKITIFYRNDYGITWAF